MNRLTGIFALIPLTLCASLAYSDDSMSSVTPTDQQLIKQCIERQKTTTNVTLSKAQARRFCQDELKHQKETGASPEKPPVDTPHTPIDSTSPPPAEETVPPR